MLPVNIGQLLTSSIFIGMIGIWAMVVTIEPKETTITLEPNQTTTVVGEIFELQVIVTSKEPTNAFSGLLTYDPTIIEVASIDYNTSIADLWVKEPWYENGEGTINFTGGTTKPGGFTGSDTLMTISFISTAASSSAIYITEAQILAHDGLGSEAPLKTIDALFTSKALTEQTKVIDTKHESSVVTVTEIKELLATDLNGDGKVGAVDISIFMTKLFSDNLRYDFNKDGEVSLADLSILLDSRN
jgi:hypothetical protein